MKRKETIAHSKVMNKDELLDVINMRKPQLYNLLHKLSGLWLEYRFIVPLNIPRSSSEQQRAWVMKGIVSRNGKKGLISFSSEDSEIFYGRNSEVIEIVNRINLNTYRFKWLRQIIYSACRSSTDT